MQTFPVNRGLCMFCASRLGAKRIAQTDTNYGLRGGVCTAMLPICDVCLPSPAAIINQLTGGADL